MPFVCLCCSSKCVSAYSCNNIMEEERNSSTSNKITTVLEILIVCHVLHIRCLKFRFCALSLPLYYNLECNIASLCVYCSSRQPSSSPARCRSPSPHTPPHMDTTDTAGGRDRKPAEGGDKGKLQSRGSPRLPENALLKVTEAHLAILPDEDGDT